MHPSGAPNRNNFSRREQHEADASANEKIVTRNGAAQIADCIAKMTEE
jgi:hypothetical protein